MASQNSKPLRDLVMSGQVLATTADNGSIALHQVARNIRLSAPFFVCFGTLAQIFLIELESKATKFEEACERVRPLKEMVDGDISRGRERQNDSLSRYLIRIKRGAEFICLFCTQFLSIRGESLVVPLRRAYDQVFGAIHRRTSRETVRSFILLALTRAQLFRNLGEDESSARVFMQNFIVASNSFVSYTEGLFSATSQGRELLRMI